jgi:hypothetical protein
VQIIPTNKTIAEYCGELRDQAIIVNRDYQRSNQVWPAAAQSFLIESILLGFPVPKLALYQITDRVSRKTYREIVDGQQRTEAIRAFYDGEMRLSRTLEFQDAAGKTYVELASDLQDKFLAYPLGIDLFVDATPRDVREVFRRINAYEVPLNPEEQRHAKFQGDFKWFIYHLSSRYDQVFQDLGTFGQKQLVRMQDMKLLAEVAHALLKGIKTTSRRDLDKLYEQYDEGFAEEEELESWLHAGLEAVRGWEAARETDLAKPFSVYALLLAVIHAEYDVPALRSVAAGGRGIAENDRVERRLGVLADALENKVRSGGYASFVKASTDRTNVIDQRQTRFKSYLAAVQARS